jgi:hypothetical protein
MTTKLDWLFCPITGSLLTLDAAAGVARCPISSWQRSLEGASRYQLLRGMYITVYRTYYNADNLGDTLNNLFATLSADMDGFRTVSRTNMQVCLACTS